MWQWRRRWPDKLTKGGGGAEGRTEPVRSDEIAIASPSSFAPLATRNPNREIELVRGTHPEEER